LSKTQALIVSAPGAAFEKAEMPLRELAADSVAINIKYSGICHSDIHQVRDEWFEGIFPMVPGHEIVGEVTAVGDSVTKFKVGDRVGVGTFVDSCGTCATLASAAWKTTAEPAMSRPTTAATTMAKKAMVATPRMLWSKSTLF